MPPCSTCSVYLGINNNNNSIIVHNNNDGIDPSEKGTEPAAAVAADADASCSVCLGLWSHKQEFSNKLTEAIELAVRPYGGLSSKSNNNNNNNRFCRKACPPTIALPGDLLYRLYAASSLTASSSSSPSPPPPSSSSSTTATTTTMAQNATKSSYSASIVGHKMKQFAKSCLSDCLDKLEKNGNHNNDSIKTNNNNGMVYPSCIEQGELGSLCVHVIVLPRNDDNRPRGGGGGGDGGGGVVVPRPLHSMPTHSSSSKKRRKKRYFGPNIGNDTIQGGDPRINLEKRLIKRGCILWSINHAMETKMKPNPQFDAQVLSPIPVGNAAANNGSNNSNSNNNPVATDALEFHVAVWRRPFYLKGRYTKTRRDVSQTPFYVTDNVDDTGGAKRRRQQQQRRRLGVTSIEEQILPVVSRHCGGISAHNNDTVNDINNPTITPNNDSSPLALATNADTATAANGSNIVFGMAKFHAMGREDMDVRMLISSDKVTGRPFVCEVIDALRLPLPSALDQIVHEINNGKPTTTKTSATRNNNDTAGNNAAEIKITDPPRWYGRNPMGVGVSESLCFVPASSFKNLQTEAENKVKHYECLCWSQEPILNANVLTKQLGSFPCEIQQQTPVRVLHRRANMVRIRHILSCRVMELLDDQHYFRLHLSTDAGAYVKEFVHGDLGRTQPNVASLLGCKTDILELDCAGIQLS